jgi:hypothetical protein
MWNTFDYIFASVMIVGTGLTYYLISRKYRNLAYKAALAAALAGAFLLIWINAAVGIIGSEDNRENLVYVGVLGVGFIGILLSRLHPLNLSRALFATAIAHALVAVVGLILGWDMTPLADIFFVALWVGSGMLFRRC